MNHAEEALFDASGQAGWPLPRWLKAGYITYQTGHDTQFHIFPRIGESIRIISRLVDVKRLRGAWLIEIQREGDATLIDRRLFHRCVSQSRRTTCHPTS
ncbi:MAG: hypothetical protein GY759_20930 [Chloroflexi bacterium]|nr:hypothetical protein [Chloroflexota bacterium]